MAKTTEKYALMYILNPHLSEEETAAVVETFKALVGQNGTLEEMCIRDSGDALRHGLGRNDDDLLVRQRDALLGGHDAVSYTHLG